MTGGPGGHRLIDGNTLRRRILDEAAAYVTGAGGAQKVGRLVSVSIGAKPELAVYVRNQARGAQLAGFRFDQELWSDEISQEECARLIAAMNDDPGILGVVLQRPTPAHINVHALQSAIHPLKDIEGMNPASIGNIAYSEVTLAPCTAAATVALIKETGLGLHGLEVVMIGHSEIVSRPTAFLLMAEGATVTVCDHMMPSLAAHARQADVLVVGVDRPHLIGPEMVKPGAVVIDIGINLVRGADGTPRIVGDVDTEAVQQVAAWITPVPGGVGAVTVAMLMRNATIAHQRQMAAGWCR